jgi:hypothetical protein
MIYDLLVRSSTPLELREDPEQGVTVAGITRPNVTTAAQVMALLEDGNARRKTDSTDANSASSRSHAVRAVCCVLCAVCCVLCAVCCLLSALPAAVGLPSTGLTGHAGSKGGQTGYSVAGPGLSLECSPPQLRHMPVNPLQATTTLLKRAHARSSMEVPHAHSLTPAACHRCWR